MGVDRNQRAREQAQAEFAQARLRKQFIADLASGVTGAYDKDRTRLEAGHLVVWQPPPDILRWLVTDVGPALDIPQPALRVTLTITVPIILPPGQRMGNLLVVGKAEDQDPEALAKDTIAGANGDEKVSETEGANGDGADPANEPRD